MSQVALGTLDSFKKTNLSVFAKEILSASWTAHEHLQFRGVPKDSKKEKNYIRPPFPLKHLGKSGCVSVSVMVAMGQPSRIVS